MSEWQDISTAPKDGTPIMLRGDGIYHGVEFVGKWRGPQYPGDEDHWYNMNTGQRIQYPTITHWMYRSKPPVTP